MRPPIKWRPRQIRRNMADETKKLAISREWTEKERLSLIAGVTGELVVEFQARRLPRPSTMVDCIELVHLVSGMNASFLENNRDKFVRWIEV